MTILWKMVMNLTKCKFVVLIKLRDEFEKKQIFFSKIQNKFAFVDIKMLLMKNYHNLLMYEFISAINSCAVRIRVPLSKACLLAKAAFSSSSSSSSMDLKPTYYS